VPGLTHRLLHRHQHVVLRWKAVPVLGCHHLIADPHGKLAPATLDELRIDPRLLLDERRRPGCARTVVSDPAVPNSDALHDVSIRAPDAWSQG
jgi:hypothetical protein